MTIRENSEKRENMATVNNDVVQINICELVNGWGVRAESELGTAKEFKVYDSTNVNKEAALERAVVTAQKWAREYKLQGFHTYFLPAKAQQARWYTLSSLTAWLSDQIKNKKKYSPEWAA